MSATVREDFPLGTAQGGRCYSCACDQREIKGQKEAVIDLNIYIEQEGFLMFCETCVTEWANLLGMSSRTQTTEGSTAYTDLKTKYDKLKADYSLAEDVITSFTRYTENSTKN